MRANLEAAGGRVLAERVALALAPALGRAAAHEVVADAAAESEATGRSMAEVLAATPAVADRLDPAAIAALLDPDTYLGSVEVFVDRALAAHAARRGRWP